MAGLPPGFTLDNQQTKPQGGGTSGLPAGFKLDTQQPTQQKVTANNFFDWKPPMFPKPEETQSFMQGAGNTINKTMGKINESIGRNPTQTWAETAGQVVGNVIAGGTDIAIQGLKSTGKMALRQFVPEFVSKPILDSVKGGAEYAFKTLANTEIGQQGIKSLQGGINTYNTWATANPRAAANLGATIEIGSLLPIGKGLKVGGEVIEQGLKKGGQVLQKIATSKVGKIVEEGVENVMKSGKPLKDIFTRKIPLKNIENELKLTPTERGRVEATGVSPAQFMLEKKLAGLGKEKQVNALQNIGDENYNGITNKLKSIPEVVRIDSPDAKKALGQMIDEMEGSPILKGEYPEYINKLKELLQQSNYHPLELIAIRRDFDRIIGNKIYNAKGRVTGAEDEVLAKWRAGMSDDLQKVAEAHGIDIKKMNTDMRNSITIRDGLLRVLSQTNKNNVFGLQDIGIGAILAAGEPVTAAAIILGKKGIERALPRVSQALYNLSKEPYVPNTMKRGVPFTPGDTTNGFSVSPSTPSRMTTPKKPLINKTEQSKKGFKKAETQLPKQGEPLLQEARKYKTADEFVKSKNKFDDNASNPYHSFELYHGSPNKFDKFDIGKATEGKTGRGIYLSLDKDFATEYMGKNGSLNEVFIDKDASILQGKELFDTLKRHNIDISNADKLLKYGVDGVKEGKNIAIFNDKVIKTKSQLKKTREESQKGFNKTETQLPKQGEQLMNEARKFDSFEEFGKAISKKDKSVIDDVSMTPKEVMDMRFDGDNVDLNKHLLSNLSKERLGKSLTDVNNIKNGKITIYRATKGDSLRPGDRVTDSKEYAQNHIEKQLSTRGEKGKIIEQTIGLDELIEPQIGFGTPLKGEFYYAPKGIQNKTPKQIREQAKKGFKKAETQLPKQGGDLEPLMKEARKYKTAEEFVDKGVKYKNKMDDLIKYFYVRDKAQRDTLDIFKKSNNGNSLFTPGNEILDKGLGTKKYLLTENFYPQKEVQGLGFNKDNLLQTIKEAKASGTEYFIIDGTTGEGIKFFKSIEDSGYFTKEKYIVKNYVHGKEYNKYQVFKINDNISDFKPRIDINEFKKLSEKYTKGSIKEIYDKLGVKTESQLKQIREQANGTKIKTPKK